MDYVEPIQAVVPGARGRILAALLRSGEPGTISAFAERAGVSRDQAGEVIEQLEQLGLVERRRVGRAWLVGLVEESPVVDALREIEDVRDGTLKRLRERAGRLRPRPVSMTAYGSWARGAARPGSDLDVAVIAPPRMDEATRDRFLDRLDAWASYAQRVTGLVTSMMVIDEDEPLTGSLWDDVRRDGVLLVGEPIPERRRRGA